MWLLSRRPWVIIIIRIQDTKIISWIRVRRDDRERGWKRACLTSSQRRISYGLDKLLHPARVKDVYYYCCCGMERITMTSDLLMELSDSPWKLFETCKNCLVQRRQRRLLELRDRCWSEEGTNRIQARLRTANLDGKVSRWCKNG